MTVLLLMALSVVHGDVDRWRPDITPVTPADVRRADALAGDYRNAGPSIHDGTTLDPAERVPGRFVINYGPGQGRAAQNAVSSAGGKVISASRSGAGFFVAEFPTNEVPVGLIADAFSGSVEPLTRLRVCYVPNDPFYSTYQWDRWVSYADRAWDVTLGSRDVKVAVIDQGVDYRHPDLAGSFESGLKGYDFVRGSPDPLPTSSMEMHGTHVAGIIAAGLNNAAGVAGWANVTLYSCRVLDSTGSGTNADVADGIRWAADHGVSVANLSLGGTSSSQVLAQAVDYAWQRGTLVVGASGNDGLPNVYYPGAYGNAMAVGALDTTGVRASFSNHGPELDIIAPGVRIASTLPSSQYGLMDGTSMATPEVVGVAALVCSYRPGLSPADLRAILEVSACDMGTAGRDDEYGFGLVNAARALELAVRQGQPAGTLTMLSTGSPSSGVLRRGGEVQLAARARLFTAAGRPVAVVHAGRMRLDLSPGTYFLLSEEDPAQMRKIVLPSPGR